MWHEAMGGTNGGRKGGHSFFSPLLLLYFYVKKLAQMSQTMSVLMRVCEGGGGSWPKGGVAGEKLSVR